MKLRPTGFRVLIKVEPLEKYHKGGIIAMVQDEAQREHGGKDIGRVVEFGPTCYKGYKNCEGPKDWQQGFKVGSLVEFNRYDGKVPRAVEIDTSLSDYRIINDEDIIVVLEE